MSRRVVHISDAEAASDFAAVLARVRAGIEVVIEHDDRPVAVVYPAEPPRGRPVSECIALAKAHEDEAGEAPILDPEFAADLEDIIKNRKPWTPPTWE